MQKKLHYDPKIKLDPIEGFIFVFLLISIVDYSVFITLGEYQDPFHWLY